MSYDDDDVIFKVVVNQEQQYSVWPADREIPSGWSEAGPSGSKQECLDQIQVLSQALRFPPRRSRAYPRR